MNKISLEYAASIEAIEIVLTLVVSELMTQGRLRDWSNHTAAVIAESPVEENFQALVQARVDDLFARAQRKMTP